MASRARYLGDESILHTIERSFMSVAADTVFVRMFEEHRSGEGVPYKTCELLSYFIGRHIFHNGLWSMEGLVPVYLHIVDPEGFLSPDFAAAIAKPREIWVDNGRVQVVWGVAVIMREELDFIVNLPEDERDTRLVGLLRLEREDSSWWTKPTKEMG